MMTISLDDPYCPALITCDAHDEPVTLVIDGSTSVETLIDFIEYHKVCSLIKILRSQ